MLLLDFANFNNRLSLAGGDRTAAPDGYLRRCKGVAPELTGSINSMYPPQLLYPINALNLIRFQGARYQYDGTNLYQNGASVYSGGNGSRATMVSMPPAAGVTDSLFLAGSGPLVKVDAAGAVTNWGIQQPPDQMQAVNNTYDQIVIDNFDASAANYAGTGLTTKADEGTIVAVGTGSLKLNPNAAWSITQIYGSAQNWGNYPNTDFVLPTDIFQVWFYFDKYGDNSSAPGTWIEFDVDINDGTFKKDWYSFSVGLLPSTSSNPRVKHNVNENFVFQVGQWQQLTIAKSAFFRNGSRQQLDWTMVQALRIKGGNFTTGSLYLDNLTLSGGSPLGAGPAAGSGGTEYDYYQTFQNLTTGNQSNAQPDKAQLFSVAVNTVSLNQIAVSADPQVNARVLYRTSGGSGQLSGGLAFYLDTIYDNTTTSYLDKIGDFSIPFTPTPWTKNIAVPPSAPPTNVGPGSYYVDGGNGYYFKLTTPGTTGAGVPAWVVPTSSWVALGAFFLNETVAPPQAAGVFFKVVIAGKSGVTQPNWAAHLTVGVTFTDGTVTWKSLGVQVTHDNTATWTFQGINSVRTLGSAQLMFDNTVAPATVQDAAGPFAGSMVWTRDTARGAKGRVYISPPGRAEGYGQFFDIGTDNEPCQKAVIYQNQLWVLTTRRIFRFEGEYPNFNPVPVYVDAGTNNPFTVLATEKDVFFGAADGIRAFNWGSNALYAFDAIGPVQRGYTVENVAPFTPLVAGSGRDEVFFGGQAQSFAIGHERPFWRYFDVNLTAVYFEEETGEIIASYGGNTYLWEHPSYAGGPVAFNWEVQTPARRADMGRQVQSQRLYLDINMAGQQVQPTLLVDGAEFQLPAIVNTSRQLIELPYHAPGHVFSVRLTATPMTGTIELFRAALDVE